MNQTVVVSQLGARMHYAVPRILASDDRLAHFYTDICASQGWPRLVGLLPTRILPGAVRRLIGRVPQGIPDQRMTSFPTFGLISAIRRLSGQSRVRETANAIWAGEHFGKLVAAQGFHDAVGLYAFSGEALEQLRVAHEYGLWTAVEQMIAPRDVVDQLGCEEECLYPHWQAPMTSDPRAADFAAREKAEWALADTVICPSDFVYEHVLASGCPAEKAVIVPYGVDGRFSVERKIRRPGPLRVLTIGQVGLRKGSPYVLEAARRMGQTAQFRMVGSIAVLAGAQAELQGGVELTGPIPRSEMHAQFEWADVFLLPSLCEGSATAVYEALAAGLPVICTPNTGSVVRHGVDGFITAIRDVDAMVAALETLAGDADLYEDMAYQAQQRATEFTLERYGERLLAALFNRPTEMVS